MSAVADVPAPSNSASRMTDFQRRMKGLVKGNGGVGGGRRTAGQRATDKPANIRTVETLEEYKELMDEEGGKMIVVRFFATWCKVRCKLQSYSFIVYAFDLRLTNQRFRRHARPSSPRSTAWPPSTPTLSSWRCP